VHCAVFSGESRALEVLLARHAHPTLVDNESRPPLYYAAEVGNFEAVKVLIKQSTCFEGLVAQAVAERIGNLECANLIRHCTSALASTNIQCALRSVNVRRQMWSNAATILQRKFRYLQRKRLAFKERCLEHKRRREAAIVIQSAWRKFRAWRRVQRLFHVKAIRIIQPVVKGFLAKMRVKHTKARLRRELESASAVMIQRIMRRKVAKKIAVKARIARDKEVARREKAAAKAQALYRGWRDRVFVKKHRYLVNRRKEQQLTFEKNKAENELKSAFTIQRVYRGYRGRRRWKNLKYEEGIKGMDAMEKYKLKIKYVIKIQQYIRRHLAKIELTRRRKKRKRDLDFAELLQSCATKCAATWRAYVDRKTYLSQKSAALMIQCRVRQMQAQTLTLSMAIKAKMEKMMWTRLHYRTHLGDTEGAINAVRGLGNKGETVDAETNLPYNPILVDEQAGSGESAFMMACGKLDKETAVALLAEGANPNMRDDNGWTPLRYAVEGLDKADPFIWWLVKEVRVTVNLADRMGYTPMHCAAQLGNLDVILAILEGFSVLKAAIQTKINFTIEEAEKQFTMRKALQGFAAYLEEDIELTTAVREEVFPSAGKAAAQDEAIRLKQEEEERAQRIAGAASQPPAFEPGQQAQVGKNKNLQPRSRVESAVEGEVNLRLEGEGGLLAEVPDEENPNTNLNPSPTSKP